MHRFPGVLRGWNEIAGFLGVHRDTARHYFYHKDLPIRRGTGRPLAFSWELIMWVDEWDKLAVKGKIPFRKPPIRKGQGKENPRTGSSDK